MPRRWLRKLLSDTHRLREHKSLGVLGERLFHPALWCLNRRSVAAGVAAGLFCGLIPGPLQMLSAALAAILLRFNLPVALAVTLYTNPLTIVPLYLAAYHLGAVVLGITPVAAAPASLAVLDEWLYALGRPLLVGLPLLATVLALAGYAAVRVSWGLHLRQAWRRRRLTRAGALRRGRAG